MSDWDAVFGLLHHVAKPWGNEELWALNRHYAGKVLFVRAGEILSLQYHEKKDETIRILSGTLRLHVGPRADALEVVVLGPGCRYAIPPRRVHRMEAVTDCVMVEVSTPHLADVVRLEDRYGRV
ncbi:MAG: cupin domain-containing protein [Candidatus Bipolaricaulota bacterium]|nr:cupin domain-containing protein [Candidatus Bipolaricaulota bacterium]